ncbi:MAG: hypothetical protein R3Y24_10480 [Eubacteriales bacterium]
MDIGMFKEELKETEELRVLEELKETEELRVLEELKDEVAELIIEASDFAISIGMIAVDCGIDLSASLFLNIRDAMFHFKALCESTEEESMYKHYYNLKEHLLRGQKDAIIFLVQAVCDGILNIMQMQEFEKKFEDVERKQLQIWFHYLKQVILEIRISGADLPKDNVNSVENIYEGIGKCVIEILQMIQNKGMSLF